MGKVRVQDLMIGDWVSLNGKPIQITEITGGHGAWGASIHYIESTDNWRVVYLERSSEYAHLPTIEPIELEEDILKFNGFDINRKQHIGYYTVIDNDIKYSIEINLSYHKIIITKEEKINGFCEHSSIKIIARYVHQLQNAFRLLDIDFDWKV